MLGLAMVLVTYEHFSSSHCREQLYVTGTVRVVET